MAHDRLVTAIAELESPIPINRFRSSSNNHRVCAYILFTRPNKYHHGTVLSHLFLSRFYLILDFFHSFFFSYSLFHPCTHSPSLYFSLLTQQHTDFYSFHLFLIFFIDSACASTNSVLTFSYRVFYK